MQQIRIKDEENYNSIEHKLEGMGYKLTGTGSYSNVWTKGQIAFKVNYDPDPCWDKFVKFCIANSDNNYLPFIIDHGSFTHKGDVLFYTTTERLVPLSRKYKKSEGFLSIITYIRDFVDGFYDEEYTDVKSRAHIDVVYPGLKRTIEQVLAISSQCHADLHDENFMLRMDGSPVLSDPLSS